MVTINDYIKNNDDIRIRIAKKGSRDPYDPLSYPIWEGMLSDVPEDLKALEVINEGISIESGVNQIEVIS